MKTTIIIGKTEYSFDLTKPISISLPLKNGKDNPKAWWAPNPNFEPVRTEEFVGSTDEGGLLNFKNAFINPHGNGTHTECVGHIAKEKFHIKNCLKTFHHLCQVVTITPETMDGDFVITKSQIESLQIEKKVNAIAIRTLPNNKDKKLKDWSGTNPPFIAANAMQILFEKGIEHFLIDLPSVDKEWDDGALAAHKMFWNYPSENVRENCTISEMIYVDNSILDGIYLLNIQIAPLELDASPSNLVLYKLIEG